MGFDITNLTDYVKEVTPDIHSKLYFSRNSAAYFSIVEGVKGKQKLNYFENELDPVLSNCGWDGTTETSFSQREIEVIELKNEAGWCPGKVQPKWLGQLMKKGSSPEEFPFEQFIIDDVLTQLVKKNEAIIWNGDSAGSTGTSLDLVDGIFKILEAETLIEATLTGATSVANIQDKVDELIDLMPVEITDKQVVIFTSLTNVKLYDRFLFNSNLFHVESKQDMSYITSVPYNTNVTLVGVEAFGSADKYLLTVEDNLVMAVDAPNEMVAPNVWFNTDEDEIRMRNKYKIGVQLVFPEYIVGNNL